jgi:hypothetical protein
MRWVCDVSFLLFSYLFSKWKILYIRYYSFGIQTALSKRIGDVAFVLAIALAIVWILNNGSWNYVYYIHLIKKKITRFALDFWRSHSNTDYNNRKQLNLFCIVSLFLFPM